MDRPETQAKTDLVDSVVALVRSRVAVGQAAQGEEFVRQFFRQVDPDDLRKREPADLCGAVLSLWDWLRQRRDDEARIRVFNPRADRDGWQCPHTVIEVSHPDMPFLVDSVRMEVNAQGFITHLIIHPIIRVRRDSNGNLLEMLPRDTSEHDAKFESCMHLEVNRETDQAAIARLEQGLLHSLAEVRAAVGDWKPMVQRMLETVEQIRDHPPPLPREEIVEGMAFLKWLAAGHLTFLGSRDYELGKEGGEDVLRVVPGSGLGILRERHGEVTSTSFATLPAEMRERAHKAELLIVTKSNTRSTVHRPEYMDYIGVKRFDRSGRVSGERRFLGLYTSIAHRMSVLEVPLLRKKANAVFGRSGVLPGSHMGKSMLTILEDYPRDELFQIGEDELLRTVSGILHLQERQRIRLFVRRDPFGRFFSCLLYVPRDKYNTEVRLRIQAVLMRAFAGVSSEFSVNLSVSVLARVLFVVHTQSGAKIDFDEREIEAEVERITRRWEDDLSGALVQRYGEERGLDLYRMYGTAFPAGYREEYAAHMAVEDIESMERLGDGDVGLHLYVPPGAAENELRFKLFRRGGAVPLSQSLPMLEHMGVRVMDERPAEIEPEGRNCVWIHDMGLAADGGVNADIEGVRGIFEETFLRVWRGEAENDDFNKLVLRAGLDWRAVALLRAYAKYARQAGFTFSQRYIEASLASNPNIARQLVELFLERHDPHLSVPTGERGAKRLPEIEAMLDSVASLDEDRILRRLLALILATTRTNFFRGDKDDAPRPCLSLKFDPSRIPGLPEPRPMFEIFVYSPRVEGVHLRGGRTARGGLRWSDRMEDFRTEVLGLMKAQMVKNAVIVPVGAKGGYVVKMPPQGCDRATLQREVVNCYSTFLRGLLDLTDNLIEGRVVPPADVVRHDPDDTYLVVAADKGTATFSDIANGVAAEYGFWLSDAFASGGSAGYDHKKMGITARGVWESVKKHFRSLGIDIQSIDFTVAGIGDMSGDVFGNGMLQSKHIRLVAAFDHRHIFIDPDPNAEASYRERERLFGLQSSSWADYDTKKMSAGGGVYPRSAKSVALTPQARKALGIENVRLAPADLIREILRAPVDLLYNGGIGTYFKSSEESHVDVGDRSNDAVRVDARDLRCRVVGEGGNLGFTQRARIEYSLKGGLINTDAIDNSAGVDCSDHEVNIKILLSAAVREGNLTTQRRNQLLESMTDEVAALVLRDNYYQSQSLAVSGAMGAAVLDAQTRFMRFLERSGKLSREVEFLPSDEELAARKSGRTGLTSPERAVLLAYSKIWLCDELLASTVPEDPFIGSALERYFPEALRTHYRDAMPRHPLRREIIATHVCNSMVNRVGSTFVHRLMEESGARPSDVVRAYLLAREAFGLVQIWRDIDALDNKVADREQTAMLIEIGKLVVRGTLWFIRRRLYAGDLETTIGRYAGPVESVSASLDTLLGEQDLARTHRRTEAMAGGGVPAALARRVTGAELAFAALDITDVSQSARRSVSCVAQIYFTLVARLNVSWLRDQIGLLPGDSHWQTLARAVLRDELTELLRSLTTVVLGIKPGVEEPAVLISAWEESNRSALERSRQVLGELQAASSPDLAMLSVGLRELRNLV
ncbi:MAG TPA: NAD-glutamate dehydrogenase [Burkholderiales bacterium]|nr:NAD-glutamate dehydrogenase [Burkholderiales bacterium]